MSRRLRGLGGLNLPVAIEDCVRDLLGRPASDGDVVVVALPSARDPRSLVAIDARLAAARLTYRHFGAGDTLRRIKAGGFAVLILSGLVGRMPKMRVVFGHAMQRLGYRDWLKRNLPEGTLVGAVLLGPPRANRKPVVLLSNSGGDLVGVAKFGLTGVTTPLIKNEAEALLQVGGALGEILHLPKLLASGPVGTGEVLLMAPLPTPAPGLRPTRRALIEVVRQIACIDERPGEDLRDIASQPRLAPLRSRIDEVARCIEGVKVGSFHGDLHAGNLAVARDGRIILWDWERWGYGAPVGFDLLHHDLHTWISQDRMAPGEAAMALVAGAAVILAPLGVQQSVASSVGRDYLIRLAARYTADQQDLAGSGLGAVEEWLFPAVLQ